jgi:hypothetical protein
MDKTLITLLALSLTATGLHADDQSYWQKRLREEIEQSERHSERIERDWNFRQETEQRERIHREQMEQRERIRKEVEDTRKEVEDTRRDWNFRFKKFQ